VFTVIQLHFYFLTFGHQSARMSESKNVGWILMPKCNQVTYLPFKGLKGFKVRPGQNVYSVIIFICYYTHNARSAKTPIRINCCHCTV